jgi:hypothetical protein
MSVTVATGKLPSGKYNKFSEHARRMISGEPQCSMFCGGAKCKYCTTHHWKPEQMAIKGIYSEWYAIFSIFSFG